MSYNNLQNQARSAVITRLRREGSIREPAGLEIRLARDLGFCQGVERAVTQALHAAHDLTSHTGPDEPRLYMMGEIIHNPSTNQRLIDAGVEILPPPDDPDRLAGIRPIDWVIVPAFGSTASDEEALRSIGCRLIDTTCGWVRRVWKAVSDYARDGLTTVIHGKVEHEETRATASRIAGPYVIVRNREEAGLLADAVGRRSLDEPRAERLGAPAVWPDWFARVFVGRCSPGFDPERDLESLGLVNQTTMLSSETEAVAAILEEAIVRRSGGPFRTLDTFCPATQKRQDAVRHLLEEGSLDLMIVVGGFRSSNTAHLAALGARRVASYHIEDASCLMSTRELRHLPPGASEPVVIRDWMPTPPCTVGLTAGASTPEAEIDRTILRLQALFRGDVP